MVYCTSASLFKRNGFGNELYVPVIMCFSKSMACSLFRPRFFCESTTSLDASFKPDSHGKIPIEYAQDACYGHNRLVVALEWAPMFLAASQAAFKRVAKATETKLNSLREAHASYEEQLENRYNTEKTELAAPLSREA